jgi:RHS repeat-associated protein
MSRDDRGFEYAYDYGNRLTAVAWIGTGGPATVGEFAYDALGRMITAYTRFDSDVNGDGETLRYYHDGANVLMEYDDSQTPVLQRYYVHGTGYVDERAVMYDAASDADYYYTLKDLYSVDALINNRGHEVERVTYDAYGMPLMSSIHVADVDYSGTVNATDTAAVVANYGLSVGTVGPIYDIDGNGAINATDSGLVSAAYGSAIGTARVSSVGNPYLFTGRRMHFFETEFTGLGPEANTSIQYNRARHYDPQHGRWLQRDPLETGPAVTTPRLAGGAPRMTGSVPTSRQYDDGMNLYEYVKSQPPMAADPAGLRARMHGVIVAGGDRGTIGTTIHADVRPPTCCRLVRFIQRVRERTWRFGYSDSGWVTDSGSGLRWYDYVSGPERLGGGGERWTLTDYPGKGAWDITLQGVRQDFETCAICISGSGVSGTKSCLLGCMDWGHNWIRGDLDYHQWWGPTLRAAPSFGMATLIASTYFPSTASCP